MEELEEETYALRLWFRLHNFPIEAVPIGPFAIVSAILGGMIHLDIANRLFPMVGIADPNILALWVMLGVILGMLGAIKLVFWLDDQIQNDRRKSPENSMERDTRARR